MRECPVRAEGLSLAIATFSRREKENPGDGRAACRGAVVMTGWVWRNCANVDQQRNFAARQDGIAGRHCDVVARQNVIAGRHCTVVTRQNVIAGRHCGIVTRHNVIAGRHCGVASRQSPFASKPCRLYFSKAPFPSEGAWMYSGEQVRSTATDPLRCWKPGRATSTGSTEQAPAAPQAPGGSRVTEPGPPYGKLGAFRPDFRSHSC